MEYYQRDGVVGVVLHTVLNVMNAHRILPILHPTGQQVLVETLELHKRARVFLKWPDVGSLWHASKIFVGSLVFMTNRTCEMLMTG